MNAHPSESLTSIPIGLVAHYQFCPRRAWLESAGERMPASNQVAIGVDSHRRVDRPTTEDSAAVRAVDVLSREHGFHGRIDRAEMLDHERLRIVEHKATPVKLAPEVSDANRVQLALQAIALEEEGYTVVGTEVYFSTHHRRVPVELLLEDRSAALEAVERTRAVVDSRTAPAPLLDDPKCMRCSHAAICLPEERQETEVMRRVVPPDPAADVLHLTTPGSRASLSSRRLNVVKGDEKLADIPIERVLALMVHGNVDLSGALLRELMWRDIPVVWCTGYGRVVGWTRSAASPNGAARVAQFQSSSDGRIDLAREFIASKISNQATILRRFGGDKSAVGRLRELCRAAGQCTSIALLFGIEGNAAAIYFAKLPSLLAPTVSPEIAQSFSGRIGRGAQDPLNVALNYGYAMLLGEVVRGVIACGLDPSAGFLHSPGRNKPALALDLMEEFRAPLVDAAVLGAFNNGELNAGSFTTVLGSHRLTPVGRKKLIQAFERRVITEFKHPVFGYRMTWRRSIEVQARMVLGVLDGTQGKYRGITVR